MIIATVQGPGVLRNPEPNFYVDKGFKLFTMPWAPWATAGIQNGLSGIKR